MDQVNPLPAIDSDILTMVHVSTIRLYLLTFGAQTLHGERSPPQGGFELHTVSLPTLTPHSRNWVWSVQTQ